MPCPTSYRAQGPLSHLDYGFNWAPYLPAGATITASVWAADPAPVASPLVFDAASVTLGVTMVWITGGVAGTDYLVSNTITYEVDGVVRTDTRSFILQVRDMLA